MKVALLGNGKTGSKVLDVANCEIEFFNRLNEPTVEKIAKHEIIISFLPGEAFLNMIPMLMETKKPVVTGSTGFTWPAKMDEKLKEKKLTWIYASNFSLGVVLLKQLIERLAKVDSVFKEKTYSIHEIHHTDKLDAPSGTALSMKEWLKRPCEISSERVGDTVGTHVLTLETPWEALSIGHEAKNRTVFAEGAIWAAQYILKNRGTLEHGLHPFQKIVEKHLNL